jgi:drug/metabolite transporter (DMT)-like permease
VLSLVLMTIAVHEVGATPTAIMGALEPLTAVAIGILVFDELLTGRLVIGIVLILLAVLLIVLGKSFHLRTISHTITSIIKKNWRWKS